MMIILSAVAGYLLGSANTSLILGKLFYKKDVRQYGSGNAGATNTLRTLGKTAALLVVAGDFVKGMLAVLSADGWPVKPPRGLGGRIRCGTNGCDRT